MIEINLIPDVKRELLRARSMRNYVISLSIIIGSGAAAAAVILGLVLGGQIAAEAWQDSVIKDNNKKLMAIKDLDKSVTLQHQLATIDQLHANKSINSRLFDVISAINPAEPNNVQISMLKYRPEDKTISIEGSAVNGYIALEVFKKTIINTMVQIREGDTEINIPLAENIQAGTTNFGENAQGQKVLRFSFTFTYPDELFAFTKDAVAIVTPTGKVDVTDSRLGVPASLFESKEIKNGQ